MKKIFSIIIILLCTYPVNAESLFEISLRKAKEGNAMAQNDVAAYYRTMGYCDEAFYWYKKAVAQGDKVALYGLGQCYGAGCGVEVDYTLAAYYIEQSAQKGLKEAQEAIALMYKTGLGVQKDMNKAYYWQNKANNH